MLVSAALLMSIPLLMGPLSAGAEEGLVTRAHLRAGQMYDLAGKRDEAIVRYKIVLLRQNVFDSRDQAQRGLKQPSQN
jgi:hypothetical protein